MYCDKTIVHKNANNTNDKSRFFHDSKTIDSVKFKHYNDVVNTNSCLFAVHNDL